MWLKNFIEGIQNSDEKIKRRWLILFSAAAGMVVVALWVLSMFLSFSPVIVDQSQTEINEPGFWDILKNGAGVGIDAVVNNFKNVISQITNKKTIVIE